MAEQRIGLSWEERKAQLLAKQQRENPQPPAAERPRQLTTAQRMDRAWRRRRYLGVGQ